MQKLRIFLIILTGLAGILFFLNPPSLAVEGVLETQSNDLVQEMPDEASLATLAGGCFWCVESEFRSKDGVLFTQVGYTGGDLANPTYQDITTGKTGHAEAVEVYFDPGKITYEELIRFFLTKAHDPTQLNRQGVDVGTQYRSEIFYHDNEQKEITQRVIAEVEAKKNYNKPIVTKLSAAQKFWLGETYHQQYYEKYEREQGQIHPRVYFKRQAKKFKSAE